MHKKFQDQENIIKEMLLREPSVPIDGIILIRLINHINVVYSEKRNELLKKVGLNETLFIALLILYYQAEQKIQPSKLSEVLGSSRTNATRIADELVARGWVNRQEVKTDRRCFYLYLTEEGNTFINQLLPPQWQQINSLFSELTKEEMQIITKLLYRLSQRLEVMG